MSTSQKAVTQQTERRLNRILTMYNEGQQKALLANLRRGVGKVPGELPELWGILLEDLPEEMLGKGKTPSHEEWAIYTALTLFAVHQQGNDPKGLPMHQKEKPFGSAVAALVQEGNEERILHRFNTVATADSMPELSHHLRGLVQLLRAESVPMDYAKLAGDLYRYQFPETRGNVRLNWGQDFYRVLYQRTKTTEEESCDE